MTITLLMDDNTAIIFFTLIITVGIVFCKWIKARLSK